MTNEEAARDHVVVDEAEAEVESVGQSAPPDTENKDILVTGRFVKFFFYISKSLINICNLFFIQEPNRSRCLGVFNLGRRTSEDEFRRIFERYGKIEVKPHYFKF